MPSDPKQSAHMLPYKVAVLCYLYDDNSRLLLLHRAQDPNRGMYSPIGGKVHIHEGESPHDGALREIHEEVGIELSREDIRLTGIVAERAYEGESHWLLFLFEAERPIMHEELAWTEFKEGALEWIPIDQVASMPIPRTDRDVMWPLVQTHRHGFFMVQIDCSKEPITWRVTESINAHAHSIDDQP